MKNDGKFKKGFIPWNKGVTGYMGANRTSFKKGDNFRPLKDRFEEKVYKENLSSCWVWIGHKNNKGYGVMNIDGKVTLAHRISYEMHNELIPSGMKVLHACDRPDCVQPMHLFIGTQQDNMRDMYRKGRGSLGEARTQSKLTFAVVSFIRRRYAEEDISQRQLAKDIGISQAILCDVINFKRWK